MPPPYHIRYGGDGRPDSGLSCGELILHSLRQHQRAKRPAQIEANSGSELSFRELLVQTVHAAEGWRSVGLGRGDVVVLVARNSHEVFPATMGAVVAGLTVACVVPHSTESELRHALSLARPRAVVSEPGRLALAMAVAPEALHVALSGDGLPVGVLTFVGLLRRGREARPAPDPNAYRAADVGPDRAQHAPILLFSSGTTGLPKGVRVRDTTLTLLYENHPNKAAPPGSDEVLYVTSQLCWISGVWQLLLALNSGMTRVFATVNDEVSAMYAIDKYKATYWQTAPSTLSPFVSMHKSRYQSTYSLVSLRCVMAGGSTMGASVHAALQSHLGCSVTQAYGSTEVIFVLGVLDDGVPSRAPGALGTLLPWVELRLVNVDTGEDVPPDARHVVGEVRVRSPYVMLDYVNSPEETAAAYDELGFFKTGDLVYEDDDGYFFMVDRIKEMIKYKTTQIAPAEVETVLLGHPGVREACVLGKPSDEEEGELPVAFVSRSLDEAGAAVTEEDLQALVAETLTDHKRLRGGVVFLDQLPKNVNGKVARRQLRDRLVSTASGDGECATAV